MINKTTAHNIHSVFPCPIFICERDSNLTLKEEKEIEIIIKEGLSKNYHANNSTSINSYIFNGKLKKIKQFCEQQIKIYVEQIIDPEEALNIYITQSWLNITKPGEWHHNHSHANSIISGVFYISVEKDDKIFFEDPNIEVKGVIKIKPKESNVWNSFSWYFPVNNNELILFPSWLNHNVKPNKKATRDRISLSFNTFIKGNIGDKETLSELILR